ncbi:PAS domain S-box protein [Mucilaginibacter lacusdianchii]|uniref:PAS domain S-box protein n=1 Tax=Mucilaginibacter lacusdianchii TaxID=2684211 RepID=UPI00131ABA25|nr:PAS domain S-box protein [Mucilaginibacter sp. JXJ CY 39]
MFIKPNPIHLEALKALTVSLAGITDLAAADCRGLSFTILVKTKLAVSDSALQRLYGFVQSKFPPSLFTLNVLSIFCGYDGWEMFCQSQISDINKLNIADKEVFDNPLFIALLETLTPTVILKANIPDFTIITYNKAYEVATYTQKKRLRGLTFWQAFDPKNAGGDGPALLSEAFYEAINNQRVVRMEPLQYNIPFGTIKSDNSSWWDIQIMPIVDNGICKYLLIYLKDITERVLNKDEIEQAIFRELTMAEDLAEANVKLSKAIKSLAESHDELTQTKRQLEELNEHLEHRVLERTDKLLESETRQRQLIDNAPIAIAVLRGASHVVETANKKIIEYWGKDDGVLNKPLAVALPELKGQPFIEILDDVRKTGVAYRNSDLRAFLNVDKVYQARHFDMIYQPVQLHSGVTDSIYIIAVDITDHINAKRRLELSEHILNQAVMAANIGTWSVNPNTRVLSHNSIYAKILGWDSKEPIPFERVIAQVTHEFREHVVKGMQSAIESGKDYKFTYLHKRFNDGQLIWLQGIGRTSTDNVSDQIIFSGIIKQIPPNEGESKSD